ncbi:hypothetical protein B0J13DRAFT_50800 [Dactylonectria estremocensis]|uniref:Nephrocystin 3-like N-terminal domain-containing protein n=1 Tax=Dactylonectria estremocensis TaxID=1079267 RepID=A0A9P9ERB8_9HYPO|nr:hypothetical protein B0J13DRAFT_50800 [Dactylonectria estremocensis]
MDGSVEGQAAKALTLVSDGMSAFAGSSELWASALGKLSLEDRKIIEAAGEIKLKVTIDSVYKEAKEAQETLEGSRTIVEFRGRDYELYSIWTKIVEGIQAFQSFVSSAVKLDVSGHAALPWAVIQLIIKPLIAEKEQFETVSTGMVTIAEVITYYAEFEQLYLRKELEVVRLLKESVQGVYEQILRFLCLTKAYFDDKKSHNPLKKLWGIASKTKEILQSPLNDIESGNAMVNTWANLVRRETEVNILDELTKIQTDLRSHERWKLLRWISKDSALEDHAKYGRDRLQDSGMWLLNHLELQAWRHSPSSSTMWLRGSVGTGKSTLMSLVIDSFLERLSATNSMSILYFYCKEGQDPEDVLRNLVRQLIILKPDISPSLTNDIIDRSPLGATECIDLITLFVKKHDYVTIAIDSLDKCYPEELGTSKYNYLQLLEGLISLLGISHRPIKILFSSGMEDAKINAAFKALSLSQKHCISVDEQPSQDIERFIRSEVLSWSEAQFLPSEDDKTRVLKLKETIIEKVTRKAGHMFLWAAHVLIWFRDHPNLGTETAIRQELELNLLPKPLKELYDSSYNIIAGPNATGDAQSAARAMMLLFCAKNPLLSTGLIDAVRGKKSVDEGVNHAKAVRDLVASCQGFVLYDRELDVFRFRHPSVEQYLKKQEGYEAEAHLAMAEACLASILHEAEEENDDDTDEEEDGDDSGEEEEEGRGRPRSRGSTNMSQPPDRLRSASLWELLCQDNYSDLKAPSRDSSADGPSWSRHLSDAQRSPSVPNLPTEASKCSRSLSSTSSVKSSRSRLSSRSASRPASVRGVKSSDGQAFRRKRLSSFSTDNSFDRGPDDSRWAHARWGKANFNTVIQDFHGYATLYWAAHYRASSDGRMAREKARDHMQELLLVDWNFNFWTRWVQRLLSQQPFGFYNDEVETELTQCIEHPPTPFQVACVYGFSDIIQQLCEESPTLAASTNINDTTGLHLACRFGRLETVNFFAGLESADKDFVAEDKENKSALHHAVETAKDQAIVKLLLKTTAKKFQLKSAVLEAAMSNPWCAEGLVKQLLGGRGGAYRKVPKKQRTTRLALAAITYPSTSLGLFEAVSDSSRLDIKFLITAAKSRCRRGMQKWPRRRKIWKYLLSCVIKTKIRADKTETTERVLKAAVQGGDNDLVGYILEQEKPLFLGEIFFSAAASNEHRPHHLVNKLLDAKIPGVIGGRTLRMAMINPAADSELVSLLCKPTPPVVREVGDDLDLISSAAKNCELGAEMLALLPEMESIRHEIPDSIVGLAVANGNLPVLKLILPARSPEGQESDELKEFFSLHTAEEQGKAFKRMVAEAPGEAILADLCDKKPTTVPRLQSEAPEDDWDRRVAECLKVILQHDGANELDHF